MASLPSRCPDESVRMGARTDPFYDDVWPGSSSAWWSSAQQYRSRSRAGLARVPRSLLVDEDEAWRVLREGYSWESRLRALAVLQMWRTATGEQLAAMSGLRAGLDPVSKPMRSFFSTGLVEMGLFMRDVDATLRANRVALWRPAPTRAFDRGLAPLLSSTEHVQVTGGLGWDAGRQYDRHNLLTTELGLRLCEVAPVGTVLGERFATHDMLVGSGLDPARRPVDGAAADMVVVRPDGVRVAVELTASAGSSFERKMRRWFEVLTRNSSARSGLVVLVVCASVDARDGTSRQVKGVRTQVTSTVQDLCREFGLRDVHERVLVSSWAEMFPGPGLVSDRLWRLTASRFSQGAWEEVDLLGPDAVQWRLSDPERMVEVLRNAQVLAGVPVWLRDPAAGPELWPDVLRRAGYDRIPGVRGNPGFEFADAVAPARLRASL